MVKTQAVLKHVQPQQVASLLLDSSKVRLYNKRSRGRRDIRQISVPGDQDAKIVQSITQSPLPTKQKIISVTFMHARPLGNGTYLVVSRAVVDNKTQQHDNQFKSEILLGVNLLEPTEDSSGTRMTSVMHIHSPALPALVASRLGVQSAVSFVKDLRQGALCQPQSS